MSLDAADRYPRYRAPAGDGQTLCVPAWHDAANLLENNREAILSRRREVWGHSLPEWAQLARAAVLTAASSYTRAYADVEAPTHADVPFVLTGHQPGFAHPGVWLKNFAAAELAQRAGGVAISLVIDSDLCRSTSILVPAGSASEPRSEHVAFDLGMAQTPWEERPLVDRFTWESFGKRAAETIAPLVANPLVAEWWANVATEDRDQAKLATVLSRARHRLELEWHGRGTADHRPGHPRPELPGTTLEIPQSLVCQTASFREFAVALLDDAEGFRTAHNEALAEYRREHKLRNHAQPVPDLASDDGWMEVPFWVWSKEDPARRSVFVKRRPGELRVSDRRGVEESLPCPAAGKLMDAVERLAEWESRGLKLRTRALVTTMFARLLLSDVFIHGIGGAKYDQATDAICERLFGFRPPGYITLTGTLRLPIPHELEPLSREPQLRRALRELEFHAENLAVLPGDRRRWDELVEQKRRWVATAKTPENAAERHGQIVAANTELAQLVAPERDRLHRELTELDRRRRANQVLDSREYASCLFPREVLHGFLLDFSSGIP